MLDLFKIQAVGILLNLVVVLCLCLRLFLLSLLHGNVASHRRRGVGRLLGESWPPKHLLWLFVLLTLASLSRLAFSLVPLVVRHVRLCKD